MWLLCALITFFAWGGADLFYKKAAIGEYSHLKTTIAVGLVMGASAILTLAVKGLNYDPRNLLRYLPVSLMYILSMAVGYFGLRYLELSISSPIQNASGAVSSLLMMVILRRLPDTWSCIAIVLITAGVVLLGIWERQENLAEHPGESKHFQLSAFAILIPVLYCVIDSLGTLFDGLYLDSIETTPLLGVTEETLEDTANVSYQLTFLIAAILLMIYLHGIKRVKLEIRGNGSRFAAALLETGGQLSYVYALSGNGIVAAPVISAYCVASVCFGRLILGEKLEMKKYIAIGLVTAGIVILGLMEGLNG